MLAASLVPTSPSPITTKKCALIERPHQRRHTFVGDLEKSLRRVQAGGIKVIQEVRDSYGALARVVVQDALGRGSLATLGVIRVA